MSLEIVEIDKPFAIKDLPLDKVYVIDNYLETSVHHWMNQQCGRMNWSKSNQVQGDHKNGLPHHELWGGSFYRQEAGRAKIDERETPLSVIHGRYFNRKICTDFQFKWKRFQYMGLNSQTHGQHGTTHADCDKDDSWNLSFLYYYNTFWNPKWGGDLRFYNDEVRQYGLDGRDEHIKQHSIGSVEFKPNRLLIFDGRIPHGADAPHPRARYADRKSIVLRGDEVELVDKEEFYNANDRLYDI
jgi:hypothetical protein